jgi:hypothetical protein
MEKIGRSFHSGQLRLWPGVVVVVIQWLIRFVIPSIMPNGMVIGIMGGLLGVLGIAVWWIFFSRASGTELNWMGQNGGSRIFGLQRV